MFSREMGDLPNDNFVHFREWISINYSEKKVKKHGKSLRQKIRKYPIILTKVDIKKAQVVKNKSQSNLLSG